MLGTMKGILFYSKYLKAIYEFMLTHFGTTLFIHTK